ncbi:protein tyrosine phosphatase receptor type Fa isoform X10 [Salvelinus fontinalis]|uniref:protein tyrosine phosphatase receptor type Fa isoform X10 n=1 Tax=Salvelinus fontinalis TaxID=8038 RepID=UPI002485B4EE|nr:protein tyrosine phosphatase receptor type Fa isoform X10 [Salvelinus fontinalis]
MAPHHRRAEYPLARGAVLILLLGCLALPSPSHADSMPSFIKSPDDQTGISGGVASFVCQAVGDPKPRITWMKKGKKVSSQRFEVIEFDDGSGSVLRIQPLRTHRDEAIYECTAINSVGEINTSAKLTVLEEDQIPHGFPTIDMGPQLKVVERTRTATMLCAASGNPDPEISWFKDFLPVDINSSNGRIKQLRSGALQIENSEESDQGKYECVAVNSAGTRYSAPANLYVRVRRVPPRFSIPPNNHEVMPGGSVNLTCVAVGAPMPYVKWMMGVVELTKEEEMPIGRNVLEVTNIRQSANYTCVAISSLGMIETTAQITVKALPKPPTSLIVTETTATSVTLTWDSGNPEPVSYYVIQYRAKVSDNGFQEVDGVATTRYSIGGLSPYSEYEFHVMAVNNIGRGPPSSLVDTRTSEQAPSSPPLAVQARMLSASTMLVQWEPPEEPNGQIRGYRVYYSSDLGAPLSAWHKHNTDDSRLTTISGLTTDITYSLRVLGFTSVGDGPPSDVLQVKTQQGVPAQPSSFEAEAELDTRIMLSWLWPVQDQITKYELMYWEANSGNKLHVTFPPAGSYAVEGLKPDTLYMFSLAARSEMGLGVYTQLIEARTAQSTPSAPPQEVVLLSLSSTSIKVSWRAPPAASRHGDIVRYTLAYKAATGEDLERHEVSDIGADVSSYILEGLEKWTEYQVWVRAHTDVGPGPESPAARIRTKEDVPGAPPRKVEADALNSTALRVMWKPPLQVKQHGQIRGYQVVFSRLENGAPRGQPNIMDVSLPEAQWNVEDSTDYETVITGLLPETTYSVTVAAYTTKGDGARSKAKVVTTTGAVPGRPTMMISTTIGNTALIQWQPPKEMVGEHMGYQLQYKRMEESSFTVKDFKKIEDHFTVTGLHKGATYVFKLCAKNRVGNGEEYTKEITTPDDVPSSYPQNLSVVGLTTTTTKLAWEPPVLAERNGKIVQYVVVYRDINSQQNHTNSTTESQMTIMGLQPDTTYDIRIRAFTSKGGGPISPSIQSRTMSTAMPEFTKNFGVKAVMKTSVLLTWEVPETYKSQVPFKILYNQQSVEVQGNLKRKLITRLQPDTDYSFVLMSRGNSAGGLQQQVSIRTAPNLLKTKPIQYQHHPEEGGKLTITLPRVPTTAPVRWYYIVVVPVTPATLRRWENPEDMDLDELLEASSDQSLKRRQTQEFLRPYIAAKMDALPDTFPLGDEKQYNGFYNKPLPGQQQYLCFVLAALKDHGSQKTFAASPYSDPITVKLHSGMARHAEDPEMLWVMGPVLAVVLIIVIVIAILLFKRKRASPSAKDEHSAGVKDSLLAHSSDPVEMRRLNYQTQGMMEHPLISTADLSDHIERLKANDGLRFSQEYESVDPGQQFTWEHSNLEVNKPKNRYANVIAYDHSRVILTSIDGVPGSDYINANYIDGYRKQNDYIATQGPLPETLSDFWRMVWEQRTNTIVMMTRLEEKSRVKCDQYWPSRGTETYGMIQVTMLDTVELATYSVRTFTLYKNGSSEKREVRQFQFMAWPDHGVPEYPTPTLAFLRRVKACNPTDAGPMVVHCSAGVGRTGCFIVIEAMLERMKHEKSVDIYGHVTCMRAQRNYMVQTEDQYIFIHEALLEAATCGNTEVPARNLYAHIQKLTQVTPGGTVSTMELEFKKLSNSKAHTSRFISANLPCNKFKNRLVNIMPFESTRVYLQPIRGVEGSDYINASFIDGYRQQKAYIATQGPLAETTEDFWRMLWEHNSTIVVMLTKLREMGREKCHQYWPAERSARYQYFVVDPMAEYNMPQYILREFKVTDARDGQSRTIRQFQFTDWPEQGVPKTGEGFIDFIGQVHKTKEQFGQDGPISVHCSAGVGRTGVFITLSIVLERMRYEGVVDIFHTAKTLRTQRPAMVQTEDQYQLCYRAALEYLGSFDHYAT